MFFDKYSYVNVCMCNQKALHSYTYMIWHALTKYKDDIWIDYYQT